jgi:Na+-transporting NADH:ubiquinone oxidoreductase subunit C
MARDSFGNTLLVATVLCVVCSVLVAGSAVGLRSRQVANQQQDEKKNVLIAAGLFDVEENTLDEVNAIFDASIDQVLIDLETGELADSEIVDPETYDQREAARKPELSLKIEPTSKLGGIKRREKYSFVYQVKNEAGNVEKVVLPVYGKGLWSTLYGFIAVGADANTVEGITFYEHKETPGLGGEVDNPDWKALWLGKKLFDSEGEVALQVIKGPVNPEGAETVHQVDGLSGATITCKGVTQLVSYWMGADGFGPFLDKLRQSAEGGSDG